MLKAGIFLVGMASTAVMAADRPNPSVSDEVRSVIAAERAWSAAVVQHDAAKVAAILSDDFMGADGRGIVTTKADELREAEAPPPGDQGPTLVAEQLSDLKVRIYGETAVLTASNAAHFKTAGKESVINYRRTTIYIRQKGQWRCVGFHGSRIANS